MRYYQANNTLIIRGNFRVCSSGPEGGIKDATSLLIHPVPPHIANVHHYFEIEKAALRSGLSSSETSGIITSEPAYPFCIFRYDGVTIFISSGKEKGVQSVSDNLKSDFDGENEPFFSIVCVISGECSDKDLLHVLVNITQTKTRVLINSGHSGSKLESHGIIIGSEKNTGNPAKNPSTLGKNIKQTTRYGISYVLSQLRDTPSTGKKPKEPRFFIHASIGGERWIEWEKGGCPYYPCHFKGQRCDYCYCPLYPCEDECLGEWTTGSRRGGQVWSCAPCTLNHQPVVVHHLRRNPEASVRELKSLLHQKLTEQQISD